MNLTTLVSLSNLTFAGGSNTSSQSTGAVGNGTPLLNKATQRIQAEVNTASTQLSSLGVFKSAVSQLQLSSKALGSLSSSTSASDVTKAAATLFNTFNDASTAAKASPAAAGASRDLQRALNASPALSDAMRKLGLGLQSDGTLQHDAKKFAAALKADPAGVTAALKTIGQQLNTVTTQELASDGKVNKALTSLTQRSSTLAAQQKALAAVLQSSSGNSGLSSYWANS